MIIDRASITNVDFENAQKTIEEIHRVLKKEGFFFFNPYSDKHYTYLSSTKKKANKYVLTEKGSISGIGFVCFYDLDDIKNF